MGKYFDMLMEDVRMQEGLTACMNCGICTGVCPAAEFYCYDPRQIVNTVQTRDDDAIEKLLRSDTIWYCGECMSCRPRCPRGNTPAYVIQSLRSLSQRLGFFTDSEKGRQQFALKRTIGQNILSSGYCVRPEFVDPDLHPEQGPVWKWVYDHAKDVFERFGDNYGQTGPGACRKIDEQSMEELHSILSLGAGGSTKMVDPVHDRIERVFHPKFPTEYIARPEKIRQDLAAQGVTDPKKIREAEEKAQQRKANRLYGAIAVVFVLVAALLVAVALLCWPLPWQ